MFCQKLQRCESLAVGVNVTVAKALGAVSIEC